MLKCGRQVEDEWIVGRAIEISVILEHGNDHPQERGGGEKTKCSHNQI
jgi:hypothetical protein